MRHAAPRLVPLLATLAVPILGACGEATGPGLSLPLARARWEAYEPAAYRMTVQRLCYCIVEGPVDVVVRDGVVQSARESRTGAALTPALARTYTVEALFETIERAVEEDAVQLDVEFEPRRGYPVRIVIDGRREIADDELTVIVSDLAPL